MKRGGPIKRKTPMKRGVWLRSFREQFGQPIRVGRYKPLRRIGAKGKRNLKPDDVWRRQVRERWGVCAFSIDPSHRCGGSDECHHVNTKAARPDLRFEAVNGVLLCEYAHDWVGAFPNDGRAKILALLHPAELARLLRLEAMKKEAI